MQSDPNQMRLHRRSLAERLVAMGPSPAASALAQFQRDLADALLAGEAALAGCNGSFRSQIKNHVRLLRSFGDAIAWLHMHPHAIRQFRKGGLPGGQHLSAQREALEGVLTLVDEIATTGIVAIATDLTTDLRVGDIIACDDYAAPTIIECKRRLPRDNSILLGRVGRQFARLRSTADYLETGTAEFPGESLSRLCIETDISVEPEWSLVESAIKTAVERGGGVVQRLGNGQVLWVSLGEKELPHELIEHIKSFKLPVLGVHTRYLDDDSPLMPPPLAWPISAAARLQLLEDDISLTVILDAERFEEFANECGSKLVVNESLTISVDCAGETYVVSDRFIGDCLYNFQPIEAQVRLILDFVERCQAMSIAPVVGTPPPRVFGPPPRVHHVRSIEEGHLMLQRDPGASDVVLMSGDLACAPGLEMRPRLILWETGPPSDSVSSDSDS